VDVINQRGWCHVPGIGGTWAGRIVSATGWLTSVVLAAAAARVYVLAVEPSSSLLGAALAESASPGLIARSLGHGVGLVILVVSASLQVAGVVMIRRIAAVDA
jgi:Flp pilus assembly protein TadB